MPINNKMFMRGGVMQENNEESGQLSIKAENIFPIIKKWLYSDRDIFLRELISNGVDAITKLKGIASVGDYDLDDTPFRIDINIDTKERTISVSDNGIGMSADEIKKYINQIAFSSAQDFIEKFKGKDSENQIIGHFGLGFYSTFMVSDLVEIESLSSQKGAEPVQWSCDGSTNFSLKPGIRKERGSTVTLHISKESEDLLNEFSLRGIITRYCDFLPYPIYLNNQQVNKQTPLWVKNPNQVTEQEYKDFFKNLFPFSEEPLFWVHLNVDFPFKLQGILYFPKITHELDASQGKVFLYCNQVFVAENCKEIIPEYLLLLKGAIDCPDIPLNVSRSALQNDPTIKKISEHITKKISDRLTSLYKTQYDRFIELWPDINPFIKFGMMKDQKFYEKMKETIIYRTTFKDKDDTDNKKQFTTLSQYIDRSQTKDGEKKNIYYASDATLQGQYIRLYQEQDIEVLILDSVLDTHFINYIEMQEKNIHFQRVDADVTSNLVQENAKRLTDNDNKTSHDYLKEVFEKSLSRKGLTIRVEEFRTSEIPAMIIIPEFQRRMKQMSMFMGGQKNPIEQEHTLVINSSHAICKNILKLIHEQEKENAIKIICEQVYDLALLAQKEIIPEGIESFLSRSATILEQYSSK